MVRNSALWGSIIPELQNQVTHCDVTNRVTNSKILIFRVSNSMGKKFNLVLELVMKYLPPVMPKMSPKLRMLRDIFFFFFFD